MRRVAVIGGGLAGITAALDCAGPGASVTLVEVRRRLGGAAYSFERAGLRMDNGQHVFLRCCEAYRALLQRLGSTHLVHLQERLDIPVLSPGHPPARIRRSTLRAPMHLASTLLSYPRMTPLQRVGAARVALALARLDPADPALERETFGAWLTRHGQDETSVAALWDLVALPTMNVPAAEGSLALAAFVFQRGLLSSASAADIGLHVGTLQQIIGDPARRELERAGVEVRLGWRAERVRRENDSYLVGGHAGGEEETIAADSVIVALPHDRAGALLEPLLGAHVGRPATPESSPIVNLHVIYDRRVLDEEFAAGVGTPVQYLFDRTKAGGAPAGCQYLAVSLSSAFAEMECSVEELRSRYLPAMEELLPAARGARVERFLLTREHAATFRASPGVAALRPSQRTGLPGLAVAGAWTDTGWPATLESAVLSGHAAAEAVLSSVPWRPTSDPAAGRQ